jgi:hypothetical protein
MLVTAEELAKQTGDRSFYSATSGVASTATRGAISALDWENIIKAVLAFATAVLNWMTSRAEANRKILYCKQCGAWQKI